MADEITSQSYSRGRLASILTTHSRSFSFSVISEMSDLDSGLRLKPCPVSERSLEEQLRETQEDLQRILEFAYVIVEENNALKNILKGAVIACEDGDMLDFCETLIHVDHELPILKSLQSSSRKRVQAATNTHADITNEAVPKHSTDGPRAQVLKSARVSINGASASRAPEHVSSSTATPLDVATSIRKLASLALTDSWRARHQESIEAELHATRSKGPKSKGRGKKSPMKRAAPKRSSGHKVAASPQEDSPNRLVLSSELDLEAESPRQSPLTKGTQRVDNPRRSPLTGSPRGSPPTNSPGGSPPTIYSPRGSPQLKSKGSSLTGSPRGSPPTNSPRGSSPTNSPRGSPRLKPRGSPLVRRKRGNSSPKVEKSKAIHSELELENISERPGTAQDPTLTQKNENTTKLRSVTSPVHRSLGKPQNTTEYEPRFYTGDLLPIIQERNDLKEKVLQLEDQLHEIQQQQQQANSPTPSATPHSTFSTTYATRANSLSSARNRTAAITRQRWSRGSTGNMLRDMPAMDQLGVLPSNYRFALRPVIGPKEHYITDISVIRCQKMLGNKFVYVIHTVWSDRNRYEIYRRYGEFFTFQNTLAQLFPVESGKYKSSERVIPTLPTIDNLLSILGRTNSESVLKSRLETINNYCKTLLLHLDTAISHSVFVVNFFKPYPGDQQLERLERPRGQTLTVSLYPLEVPAGSRFEHYTVLADHQGGSGNEITVKAGEIVKVINKEENGWWLVSRAAEEGTGGDDGSPEEIGYIPGTFLKRYEGLAELQNSAELQNRCLGFVCSMALGEEEIDPTLKYIATEDYTTDDPRQISFTMGTTLIVVEKSEDGWWLVCHDGREGWAPSSYLEPLEPTGNTEEEKVKGHSLPSRPGQVYKTRESYAAQLDDEISFPENASVEVIEKSITGWWHVRYDDKIGVAPASLLRLAPHHKVPQELKFAISADLGHAISGINQPPPRRQFVSQRQRSKTTVSDDDDRIPSPEMSPVSMPVGTWISNDGQFRSRVYSGVPTRPNREQLAKMLRAQSPPMDFKALVRASTLKAKEAQEIASTLAEKRHCAAVDVSRDEEEVVSKPGENHLQVEEGERTENEPEAASTTADPAQREVEDEQKHRETIDGQDESGDAAVTVRSHDSESATDSSHSKSECGPLKRVYHCTRSVCEIQTTD